MRDKKQNSSGPATRSVPSSDRAAPRYPAPPSSKPAPDLGRTGHAALSFSLATILALALPACGGTQESAEEPAASAEASGGEAPAAAAPTVIEDSAVWDVLTVQGRKSFAQACDSCHPGGEKDFGPTLIDLKTTSAIMTQQIREGSGRMKGVSEARLPAGEMQGLLVYLATLGAISDLQAPVE